MALQVFMLKKEASTGSPCFNASLALAVMPRAHTLTP